MSVVIDASVALKWVFDEPDSEAAEALRNEELIAPALWLAEAGNALWRRLSAARSPPRKRWRGSPSCCNAR